MEAYVFTVFGQRGRGDHHRRRVRQVIDESREWRFQGDFHRVSVNHFGLVDIFEQVIALKVTVRITGTVKVHFYRFSIEISAVGELHARV